MREAAAFSLERIPCSAKDIPALTAMLGDDIDSARIAAARSIGGAGSEGVAAVPKLIALLSDKNSSVRSAAAKTLGEIGRDAKDAIPALKTAVKSDPDIASVAKVAIEQIKK